MRLLLLDVHTWARSGRIVWRWTGSAAGDTDWIHVFDCFSGYIKKPVTTLVPPHSPEQMCSLDTLYVNLLLVKAPLLRNTSLFIDRSKEERWVPGPFFWFLIIKLTIKEDENVPGQLLLKPWACLLGRISFLKKEKCPLGAQVPPARGFYGSAGICLCLMAVYVLHVWADDSCGRQVATSLS